MALASRLLVVLMISEALRPRAFSVAQNNDLDNWSDMFGFNCKFPSSDSVTQSE
jgi:hypothetical protein